MTSEIWWRKERDCWFFTNAQGKQIKLHPERSEALRLWREYGKRDDCTHPDATFEALSLAFLDEYQYTVSKTQYKAVEGYLAGFTASIGLSTRWLDVTKKDVLKWAMEPKRARKRTIQWSDSTRRRAMGSVKQVFHWAFEEGMIFRNPTAGLELPESQSRETTITREQHELLVRTTREDRQGRAFALFLVALWHTGSRPDRITLVTARNVLPDCSAWVFADHKTRKKTKKPLVVYLSPCGQTLTRILMHFHREGPLFRNARGTEWKKDTVCQRIERLRTRCKLPKDIVAYSYRHAFATTALLAGNDLATVSLLLGHTDTRMVAKVYSHLSQHRNFLIEAVNKTRS